MQILVLIIRLQHVVHTFRFVCIATLTQLAATVCVQLRQAALALRHINVWFTLQVHTVVLAVHELVRGVRVCHLPVRPHATAVDHLASHVDGHVVEVEVGLRSM